MVTTIGKTTTVNAEISTIQTEINKVHSDLEKYFNDLKQLGSLLKVVQLKYDGKDWDDYYNTKSSANQLLIDTHYAYKTSHNMAEWVQYTNILYHNIKID